MPNSTFVHVSLFDSAPEASQLRALAMFVMEFGYVTGNDIDRFNDRLKRYAHKAGISEQKAREIVLERCNDQYRAQLSSFGLV